MAYKRKMPYRNSRRNYKKRRITKASRALPPQPNLAIVRKSEIKYEDFSITGTIGAGALSNFDLTSIGAGGSFNQRIGNQIHVLGFDVQGSFGGNGAACDWHFVSPFDNSLPAIGDFRPTQGGPYNRFEGTEWFHRFGGNALNNANNLNLSYRFKFPLQTNYSGDATTAGVRNRLILSLVNHTGGLTIGQVSLTVRVYFQDN